MRSKIEIHQSLCKQLSDMYQLKNADYGDSFAKVRSEFPNAICIRLSDKLNRVKSIMKSGEAKIMDETIFDTLMDLANYALLECTEMIYESESKSNQAVCSGSCRNA